MDRARYIAVEGPIGVGKAALAKRLAERFRGRPLLEQADENPFLERFYDHPRKYAFQTQVSFLLARWQQQQLLWQQDLFGQVTVSSHLFSRDRIFASITLEPDELALYERMYAMLGARVVKPDLVVYLQARPEVLMQRIRRRARRSERSLDLEYLEVLCRAYGEHFFHYEETPLLVVNANDADLAGSDEELDALVSVIRRHRKGTEHYVPMATRAEHVAERRTLR